MIPVISSFLMQAQACLKLLLGMQVLKEVAACCKRFVSQEQRGNLGNFKFNNYIAPTWHMPEGLPSKQHLGKLLSYDGNRGVWETSNKKKQVTGNSIMVAVLCSAVIQSNNAIDLQACFQWVETLRPSRWRQKIFPRFRRPRLRGRTFQPRLPHPLRLPRRRRQRRWCRQRCLPPDQQIQIFKSSFLCSTGLPQSKTRWVRSTLISYCPLSSNQHCWLTSARSKIFPL